MEFEDNFKVGYLILKLIDKNKTAPTFNELLEDKTFNFSREDLIDILKFMDRWGHLRFGSRKIGSVYIRTHSLTHPYSFISVAINNGWMKVTTEYLK